MKMFMLKLRRIMFFLFGIASCLYLADAGRANDIVAELQTARLKYQVIAQKKDSVIIDSLAMVPTCLVEVLQIQNQGTNWTTNIICRTESVRMNDTPMAGCLGYRESSNTLLVGLSANNRLWFFESSALSSTNQTTTASNHYEPTGALPAIPEIIFDELRYINGATIEEVSVNELRVAVHSSLFSRKRDLIYCFKEKSWSLSPLEPK